MATKVVIVDVDLGVSVDDIISENVAELTKESKQLLDAAIDNAQTIQRVKDERDKAAKSASDKLTAVMEEAYNALIAAGDNGLPVSNVMSIVTAQVPSASAFTLRMKNILSEKGNPYTLDRKKVHGTPHYVFKPYNQV